MPFKRLLQLFLAVAILSLVGLGYAETYGQMTGLRFLFGGATGVFFRCIEYWINDVSKDDERGRNLGAYSILFMVALILGSAIQPVLGSEGWLAFAPPSVVMAAGLLMLELWSGEPAPVIDLAVPPEAFGIVLSVPAALLAVLAYGLYESVPTTLLQVYALRSGFDGTTAAYTLTAAALGNMILLYPVAAISDRIGRLRPLLACAAAASVAAVAIPLTLSDQWTFLAAVAVLGAAAGSIYALALSMIGDRFQGGTLVVANAAFGAVYAAGSIVGPLVNGFAIDRFEARGLMISVALIFATLAGLVAILRLVHAVRGAA